MLVNNIILIFITWIFIFNSLDFRISAIFICYNILIFFNCKIISVVSNVIIIRTILLTPVIEVQRRFIFYYTSRSVFIILNTKIWIWVDLWVELVIINKVKSIFAYSVWNHVFIFRSFICIFSVDIFIKWQNFRVRLSIIIKSLLLHLFYLWYRFNLFV